MSSAKLAQADRYAPYEYTAAEEYLHKAREEAGYAEYQDAIEYGSRPRTSRTGRARSPSTKQAEAASKSSRVTPATEREEPAAAPKRSEPEEHRLAEGTSGSVAARLRAGRIVWLGVLLAVAAAAARACS